MCPPLSESLRLMSRVSVGSYLPVPVLNSCPDRLRFREGWAEVSERPFRDLIFEGTFGVHIVFRMVGSFLRSQTLDDRVPVSGRRV